MRPDNEQLDITRLQGDLTQAQDRYNGALDKSLSAQLSIEQATADVGQRLRLVDPPDTSFRQSRLKKSIMTFATFVALGILLMIGTVVVGTILDQSVRSAAGCARSPRPAGARRRAGRGLAGGGAAVAAKVGGQGQGQGEGQVEGQAQGAPPDDEPVVVDRPGAAARDALEGRRRGGRRRSTSRSRWLTPLRSRSRTAVLDPVVEEPVAVADEETADEPTAVVDDDVVEEPVVRASRRADDEDVVEDELVEEPVAVVDEDIADEPVRRLTRTSSRRSSTRPVAVSG